MDDTRLAMSTIGVVIAGLLAVAGASAIAVLLRRSIRDPENEWHYYWGCIFFIATTISAIEALAGFTWLALQHDVSGITAGAEPSLWDLEQFYIWSVNDTVPLVRVNDALGWTQPDVVNGSLVGGLSLALRTVIVLPILGLAVVAFKYTQESAQRELELFRKDEWEPAAADPRWIKRFGPGIRRAVGLFTKFAAGTGVLLMVVVGAVGFLLVQWLTPRLVGNDRSWLRHWLESPAGSSVGVPRSDETFGLGWLSNAGDVVGLAVIQTIIGLIVAASVLLFLFAVAVESGALAKVGSFVVLPIIALLVSQGFAAFALALWNAGLLDIDSTSDATASAGSFLDWFGWNAARVAPFVDVTSATGWTPEISPQGWLSRALALACRVVVAIVAFWFVGVLSSGIERHLGPTPVAAGD